MANVYQREGSPWWWGRVTYKRKTYRKPLDTASKSVAERRLKEWVEELKASNWGEKPEYTFDQAVDRFSEEHLKKLKPATQKRYSWSLENLARSFEGKKLREITRGPISEFEAARRKAGASDPTIIRDLSTLSVLFTCCETWEWFDGNPVRGYMRAMKQLGGLKESPPRERYLSEEEEALLLRVAEKKHVMLWAAIILSIDTGLRAEELLGLEWTAVDLDNREITVTWDRAKNSKTRSVPLLERALKTLMVIPRTSKSKYVLWHDDGQRYFDLYHQFVNLAADHGIDDVRFHDLRRTCGCRLLQKYGMPIEHVSKWLGHSSVKVTERHYAFLDVRHLHVALAQALQRMGLEDRAVKMLVIDGAAELQIEPPKMNNVQT